MVREDALRSVAKGDSEFVRAFDDVGIAQGACRSDDSLDSGSGGDFDSVLKREEPVAGHDCSFESSGSGVFLTEFCDSLLDGSDAVLLAGTDAEGLTVFDDDNSVGADADVDVP